LTKRVWETLVEAAGLEKYLAYIMPMNHSKKLPDGSYVDVETAYMTVDGRVKMAMDCEKWPKYSIRTWANPTDDLLRVNTDMIVPPHHVVAMVTSPDGNVWFGTAQMGGAGIAASKNPIETGETSAVGRALGLAGFGLIPGSGIPSAEEMTRALDKPDAVKDAEALGATARAIPPTVKATTGDPNDRCVTIEDKTALVKGFVVDTVMMVKAGDYIVDFGKYKAKPTKLVDISKNDMGYIKFLAGLLAFTAGNFFDPGTDERKKKLHEAALYLYRVHAKSELEKDLG
jgi:hypothetical protein